MMMMIMMMMMMAMIVLHIGYKGLMAPGEC